MPSPSASYAAAPVPRPYRSAAEPIGTICQCRPSVVRKRRLDSVHIEGMSCRHEQMLLKKISSYPSLSKSATTTVRMAEGSAISRGAASSKRSLREPAGGESHNRCRPIQLPTWAMHDAAAQ
jgi:hypothetical protein